MPKLPAPKSPDLLRRLQESFARKSRGEFHLQRHRLGVIVTPPWHEVGFDEAKRIARSEKLHYLHLPPPKGVRDAFLVSETSLHTTNPARVRFQGLPTPKQFKPVIPRTRLDALVVKEKKIPEWLADQVHSTDRSAPKSGHMTFPAYPDDPSVQSRSVYFTSNALHPILTSDAGFKHLMPPRVTGVNTKLGFPIPIVTSQGAPLGFTKDGNLIYASKAGTGVDTGTRFRLTEQRGPFKEADWTGESPKGQVVRSVDVDVDWFEGEATIQGGYRQDLRHGATTHDYSDHEAQQAFFEMARPILEKRSRYLDFVGKNKVPIWKS